MVIERYMSMNRYTDHLTFFDNAYYSQQMGMNLNLSSLWSKTFQFEFSNLLITHKENRKEIMH